MSDKSSKKLVVTLIISFVIIASFTGIMGFVSINVTKNSINQLVGEQSTTTANSALNKIDLSISNKISELRELASDSRIQNQLLQYERNSESIDGLISTKLQEKKSFYQNQLDYSVFSRILVTDSFGNKVGDTESARFENLSDELWWGETRESFVFVQDVSFDEYLDVNGIEISVRMDDKRGNFIGIIHALYNFEDIVRIVDETKDESQFRTSEFDLFDEYGFLIHSTSEMDEERFIGDYISDTSSNVYIELDEQFEELELKQSEILFKYGIVEPELTEKQEIQLDMKLEPLERQYDQIFRSLDFENPSFREEQELEAQLDELDEQHTTILREYGFVESELTESQEEELESELIALEEEFDSIYDDFDFDFTFGGKGFAILGTTGDIEILHSYSRQMGYQEFPGLGWTMMIHTEMDEILSDANAQQNSLLISILSVTIIAGLLGIYFARIFYGQSKKITEIEQMSVIGQLSSNIAHDMRNPLGTIRSSVERISDQNKGENKHVIQEVERIKRSVNRMSHQVEGVLNYVRTTPLISDDHSLKDMLSYAKESIQVSSNIEIVMPENDVTIECDQEKLEITFVNLILNAVQAIDKSDGTIKIRISEKSDNVMIEFENSGIPIPNEDIAKVFEPLFTSKLKGTGLGLSSCKNIIEQHGGKISVISDPVVFTVILPKKQKEHV
ncbi:MAG: GHKL domain-containing protein [Nitrosopumilus sp.]|nr:MAG: GHKL domain-containing protein [Nitrosopumilus sp.]